MNLYESGNTENDPVYRHLASDNMGRHYGFVRSIVAAAIGSGKLWLSQSIIKAITSMRLWGFTTRRADTGLTTSQWTAIFLRPITWLIP